MDREATVNPYTGKPYSARFHKIAETRRRLPICEGKSRIHKLVRQYQTVLLVGETGSGKTTQIPQYLLELDPEGCIACTQPRRVAAMTVSARVAEEMDVVLGEQVGYTIRFDDVSSDQTRIKYLTDGMLLREAMIDPLLSAYSVLVLDEAHERTVATDILLGMVKELLAKRPELRVVVMSATLEEKKFQHFFADAPLVHIAGRMYPVEIYYARQPEANYVEAAIRTVVQLHLYEGPGDILVFLTGEDEIENAKERIEYGIPMAAHSAVNAHKGPVEVLALYSALPPNVQRRVFKEVPEGTRKIVLATNIAETSVTIDGVVFVVDTGFSKQKVYNPKMRVESLLVTPISQAASNQRSGRAGRTRPGKCFRLYTRNGFETLLQPQTYPEILRSNIGSVVLSMKKMGIEDLVHFDFVDPPAPETLMRALELLNYLGALNDDGDLTEFGSQMSHFPLEPEMSAMLLRAPLHRCADECCRIAAMLSVQNPYLTNHSAGAQHARQQFYHQTGDHLSALLLFNAFEASGHCKYWAQENFLNDRNLKQAISVYKQLSSIMIRLELDMTSDPNEDIMFANHIRKAILSGYFTQVAMSMPSKSEFATLKDNAKCILFPTTCLNRKPQFVIYNELVLTSQNYLRTVTAISDDWLIDACPNYFDLEDFDGLQRQVMEQLHRSRKQRQKASGGQLPSRASAVGDKRKRDDSDSE